ncbi:hypothetical protein JCM8097_006246 [Rhodosporidiobolus ruineniae]
MPPVALTPPDPSKPSPILPFDLLRLIALFLVPPSPSSSSSVSLAPLLPLALTCRDLLPPMQWLLFESLTVGPLWRRGDKRKLEAVKRVRRLRSCVGEVKWDLADRDEDRDWAALELEEGYWRFFLERCENLKRVQVVRFSTSFLLDLSGRLGSAPSRSSLRTLVLDLDTQSRSTNPLEAASKLVDLLAHLPSLRSLFLPTSFTTSLSLAETLRTVPRELITDIEDYIPLREPVLPSPHPPPPLGRLPALISLTLRLSHAHTALKLSFLALFPTLTSLTLLAPSDVHTSGAPFPLFTHLAALPPAFPLLPALHTLSLFPDLLQPSSPPPTPLAAALSSATAPARAAWPAFLSAFPRSVRVLELPVNVSEKDYRALTGGRGAWRYLRRTVCFIEGRVRVASRA